MKASIPAIAALCAIFAAGLARADQPVDAVAAGTNLSLSAALDGANAPLTVFAARPEARAFIIVDGGYEGARKAGVVDFAVDARLFGPLRIRGGGSYVSDSAELKPTLGLLVNFLNQADHALDAAAGVFYKPEGLDEPEGEIELLFAASRRLGDRTTLVANLVYGQDGEGTERDAEVRTAAVVRVASRILVGGDARLRLAIGTPKNGEPDFDFVAGPLVTWLVGSEFALTGHAGISVVGLPGGTGAGPSLLLGMSRPF